MKKNIPLKIEAITDTEELECRISSPRQIESIIGAMAREGSACALYYNPNLNFIMTTVLDVDGDGLWIEPGSSLSVNDNILQSRKLTLVGSDGQVKIQFTVDSASSVTWDGDPALFLPLPQGIYRLQRREYFRLSLPPSEQLHCLINLAQGNLAADTDDEQDDVLDMTVSDIELPAADISGGGIGLIHIESEQDISIGTTYRACRIELPDMGQIEFDLTVKNIVPLSRNRAGKTILRAGCEFGNLDVQTASKLQRFITDKQREQVVKGLMR